MLGAALAMFVLLAAGFALSEALLPRGLRVPWPNLIGAMGCASGYWLYVRATERRVVSEMGASGAFMETTRGAALGMLLALLTLGALGGLGMYGIDGSGDVDPLLKGFPEMALVAVMEELLMRAVVLRMAMQAWGLRWALAISTALFVAAHLPGGISVIGMLVTAAASVALSAAYLLTGRVWMPIGMHFAWNYMFSAIFSVPVSGHDANGWLHGSMHGPQWLTGGAYGVEASVVALVAWSLCAALLLRRSGLVTRTTP